MIQPHDHIESPGTKKQTEKSCYLKITLKECLTLLIGTAIPVAIGVYTTVTNEQMQRSAKLAADEQHRIAVERRAFDLNQAAEIYQQQIYTNFLDAIYALHKDGELNKTADPWVFANARYRAAHREFDAIRKAQALQFLKEKQMIGRRNCATGCEAKNVEDIISLNGLSFDDMSLKSQTDSLKTLNLSCIQFDEVSMVNATFAYANLNGVTFSNSRLNNTTFKDTSFNCVTFNGTELNGTDFSNSNLNGAIFINVNLLTAKLTPSQIQQVADFQNVIMPNGTISISKITTSSIPTKIPILTTSITSTTTATTFTKLMTTTASPAITVAAATTTSTITITPTPTPTATTTTTTIIPTTTTATIITTTTTTTTTTSTASKTSTTITTTTTTTSTTSTASKTSTTITTTTTTTSTASKTITTTTTTTSTTSTASKTSTITTTTPTKTTKTTTTITMTRLIPNIAVNATWATNGTTVAGGNGQGKELNQLSNPSSLYVDDDQTVYVTDQSNHRIVEWKWNAMSGEMVAGDYEEGSEIHQLSSPQYALLDKETDSFIICDSGNRRLMRWPRQNGTSKEIIISNIHCVGLAMGENGSVYVTDDEKDEVRRYQREQSDGTVVAGGNGSGSSLDKLHDSRHVFVDLDHSVYVSDWGNDRVMKWMECAKQGIVVAGGQGNGNNLTQLSYPQGVVVDQLGTVYVADQGNHRIMRWLKGATEGSIIIGANGNGGQSNQLNRPVGLSFDRQGNLYVTDYGNHRVQKFNIDSNE